MKHLFTLKSLLLTLVMLCGLNAWGATYQHVFKSKPSTGDNVTLSNMSWDIAATNLGGYNSDNYAGVQIGTSKKNGSITLTSSSDWNYNGATEITEVRLWLNLGGTSVTPSVKIGETEVASKGKVVKNSTAGTDWTKTSKVTFTPAKPLTGVVEIKVETVKAGYICAVEIDCQAGAPAAVEDPTIIETSTPNFGSKYSTNSTATATIDCATEGATIKYAITDGAKPADDKWEVYSAVVSIESSVPATKTLWAKAFKDADVSAVVSKEFTFGTEPEGTYFVLVTDASQIVEGAKYVITNSDDTRAMLGWVSDDNNCKESEITISNSVLELPSDFTGIITLGKDKKGCTLKQLDGLYLTATGTSKTGTNYLKAVSAPEDNSHWIITIGNDHVASIVNALNDKAGVMQHNSSSKLFSCYNKASQKSLHLYRMAKEVPVATKTGLDAVLDGNVGGKYQINCALRVNYKDANYVYASTIGGGSTATAPTAAQAKEYWSDKVENFRQNDWVAIADLDETYVGKEIEAGSVATYVENNGFPVIKFDSMNAKEGTKVETNTYRVANFNIGSTSPVVNKLWLVSPQPAEYCKVKGYVDVADADVKASYLFAQTGSEATVIEGTSYDPLNMRVNLADASTIITTSGWYVFEGVVVNGSSSLQLNAISAKEGSIETGVEGVEASSVKVYGAEGVINVVSEEVAPIAVYSANGAIVSSVEASSASIAVAPGFYIVKAGNSVSKVTVK